MDTGSGAVIHVPKPCVSIQKDVDSFFPCPFFLANVAEEVARFVFGHDSGMCKAGSLRHEFGFQHHYRSLSRVDQKQLHTMNELVVEGDIE